MEEKMRAACRGVVGVEDVEAAVENVVRGTSKNNCEECIAYLLVVREQSVRAGPGEKERLEALLRRLKKHALKISGEEWRLLIEEAEYTVLDREDVREERNIDRMVALVLEVLIKTSTAEIEQKVDEVLGEERREGGYSRSNIDAEAVEEALEGLQHLSEEESRHWVGKVVKMLEEAHLPLVVRYVKGALKKVLPLALYVHRREMYDAVERELFRATSLENFDLLEYFPKIEIENIIRGLQKNSAVFKPLGQILKKRPIHSERIVEEVIAYMKKGSRTKSIQFVKENLPHFVRKIEKLELGCEEVLQLAEKDASLLHVAFAQMGQLRSDLKEKRQQNYSKKEKRLGSLVTVISTQLGNFLEKELLDFVEESHKKDPDLLAKICSTLFRTKQPEEQTREALSVLIKGETSSSFVFTALPYIKEELRTGLIGKYLVDELSLVLFLRVLKPEDIFVHVHKLEEEYGKKIVQLCLSKPEIFTDRIISFSVARMEEGPELPPLLSYTLTNSLQVFPNMKPFLVSFIKSEWARMYAKQKKDFSKLLERLEGSAPELLLSFSEEVLASLMKTSPVLKKKTEEYLSRQPGYIQKKYKEIVMKGEIGNEIDRAMEEA